MKGQVTPGPCGAEVIRRAVPLKERHGLLLSSRPLEAHPKGLTIIKVEIDSSRTRSSHLISCGQVLGLKRFDPRKDNLPVPDGPGEC